MYASRLVPLILIVASAACHRSDGGGGGGLAIVDTLTGTVVEEWPAPPLTFDVAEDPVTGRVWAVAEHPEDDIARVWELTADGSIPQYELHPGEGGPGGTGYLSYSKYRWLDSGAIALDSGRRRGTFGSSGSDERVILDLDTGEWVGGPLEARRLVALGGPLPDPAALGQRHLERHAPRPGLDVAVQRRPLRGVG